LTSAQVRFYIATLGPYLKSELELLNFFRIFESRF